MTDPREPSYYEVALTNRQVLVVFVLMLTSLGAAFFFGVWVGRDGVAETIAVAETSPDEAGERPPEYRFFEDGDEAEVPELARLAAEPRPGTTLEEDLGSAPSPPSTEDDRRERPPAAVEVPPVRRPGAEEPGARQPGARQPGARQPGARPTGAFAIQVLSSRDRVKAGQVLEQLLDGGYPASLSTTEQAGQTMYRVRVGTYRRRAAAAKVAEEVRRKFKLDTWITAEP